MASRAAADEAAAQTLRDAKSDATTRAQVAEEKCKILEQQLKKADERVRVAMAPRLGHVSGGTGASVQAEAAGVGAAAKKGVSPGAAKRVNKRIKESGGDLNKFKVVDLRNMARSIGAVQSNKVKSEIITNIKNKLKELR